MMSFIPGFIDLLFDLINRPARIAGDDPLLLAIHQQVQAFQDHGTDPGRFALRLDDGRKRVVTAEDLDVGPFRLVALCPAAVGVAAAAVSTRRICRPAAPDRRRAAFRKPGSS